MLWLLETELGMLLLHKDLSEYLVYLKSNPIFYARDYLHHDRILHYMQSTAKRRKRNRKFMKFNYIIRHIKLAISTLTYACFLNLKFFQ